MKTVAVLLLFSLLFSAALFAQAPTLITGNQIHDTVKLPAYLSNLAAIAATLRLGRPGPIILIANFFNNPTAVPYPKVTLVHEALLHAYAGLPDSQVLGNTYFAGKGLVSGPSSNITGWMSTDCTCTPGPNNQSCTAGTASWGK